MLVSKKRLLILGVSGLTGYKVLKQGISRFDIHGTYNTRAVIEPESLLCNLNIGDKNAISKLFSNIRPEIVVNTTALHNVDYCEEHSQQAYVVNTDAVQTLLENSEKYGSRLIHISTDYVFNGKKNYPYKEDDESIPLSVYGKSKLEGEQILEGTKHVVIRPSVVYGWTPLELAGNTSSSGKPMNFALWVLTKLNKKEPLKIVTDQYASATLADSLAESILKIAETNRSGLYHISGLSCESRYDFTIKLAEKFGYDTSLISPTTSTSFVQKAKRPNYSCLDCQKAIREFGLKLLTTDQSLDVMKSQVEKEAPYLLGNK